MMGVATMLDGNLHHFYFRLIGLFLFKETLQLVFSVQGHSKMCILGFSRFYLAAGVVRVCARVPVVPVLHQLSLSCHLAPPTGANLVPAASTGLKQLPDKETHKSVLNMRGALSTAIDCRRHLEMSTTALCIDLLMFYEITKRKCLVHNENHYFFMLSQNLWQAQRVF